MLLAFLAKASAPLALVWLVLQDRISSQWVASAILDGVFALLFLIAFWLTGRASVAETTQRTGYDPQFESPKI